MKSIKYSTVAMSLAVLALGSSCASAVKATDTDIYSQLQYIERPQKPKPELEPQPQLTRTARELDPCELLALEKSENFRASGTAIARDESKAKSAAATDARNQLAQMIRVVVNGASQDYAKDATDDFKLKSQSVEEEIMNQYVYQSLNSTKPILWSVYDLSDGNIQVYVCMELTEKPEDVMTEFENRMMQGNPRNNLYGTPDMMPANVNPDAEALYELGKENCVKNDYDLGVPQLMEAAKMGSANAQHAVGMLYLYGDHVDKDTKIAFQYILGAAKGGHKKSVFQVAEMYNSGTGTKKDKEQAKFWYRKAKDLGDTRAESRLRRL